MGLIRLFGTHGLKIESTPNTNTQHTTHDDVESTTLVDCRIGVMLIAAVVVR